MPVTSTLVLGQEWLITNSSSANLTVESSGGNSIVVLPAGTQAWITCILLTGTTAASWANDYILNVAGVSSITGTAKQITASASTGAVTLSLPQNIDSGSSPTFAGLTLTNPYIAGAGGLHSFQVFTSGTAQTYTKPSNVTSIFVEVLGGGGGGGGAAFSSSEYASAGGGGGGGYAALFVASASATYTYTVGAGGAGGTAGNNPGTAGGTTTFNASSLQATGGAGGTGCPATSASSGINSIVAVLGGVGSNGIINATGYPGEGGWGTAGYGVSGAGGNSIYGGGGAGLYHSEATGHAATNYGAGGGGAFCNTTASQAGGAGSGGLIIVWEFA